MATASGLAHVLVDTPRGSRNKYQYDAIPGLYRLSKRLPLGTALPEDDEPLDVLVLAEEAMFPGCLVSGIQAEQTEHGQTLRHDRLVGAVETSVHRPVIHHLAALRPDRLAEIESFFITYNHLEGRQFKPAGRHGPAVAEQLVAEAMRRFGAVPRQKEQ